MPLIDCKKVTKLQILCSFAMYACILADGMLGVEGGPTLMALAKNLGISDGKASWIFTARSLGYFIGTLIFGPLIDHIWREGLVLGPLFFVTGLLNCAVPYLTNFAIVIVLMVVQGVSVGSFDATMAVMFFNLHGDGVAPWMEAIHFSYAAGTLISPLIIANTLGENSNIKPSYIIIGIVCSATALYMTLVPSFKSGKKKEEPVVDAGDVNAVKEEKTEEKKPKKEYVKALDRPILYLSLVVACCIFLCGYVTLEGPYQSLVALYTVYNGYGDEITGSYMTSVFSASFMVGRLLAIPVSIYLKPVTILFLSCGSCLALMLVFLIFPSRIMTWVISSLYGIVMGPIWATLWNFVGTHISLTGKASTVIVVGSALGSMTIPTLIANLMNESRPWVLPLQQVISSVVVCGMFTAIYFVFKHFERKEQAKKIQEDDDKPLLSDQ